MQVHIRPVQAGDEKALAYVQTESWKSAFAGILDDVTLREKTQLDRAEKSYARLLEQNIGHGYILFLDGEAHCIAWWDAARDKDYAGMAEIICIHSLPANRGKGYGGMMMDRLLGDIAQAGYESVMLWVFTQNVNARAFYEAKGFHAGSVIKPILGAQEICYIKRL